jgi:adenylate cyclase
MALADTLSTDIDTIFTTPWNIRAGRVVPKTEDVALAGGAVKLDAVVLYADLADSTALAQKLPRTTAAKIVRAYLSSMTRVATAQGGSIRSFDGDRVMSVFVGDSKNSDAAQCALKMNYVVTQLLRPKAEAQFASIKKNKITLSHCVGAHASEVLVVRGGVWGNNDLVFVGSAPNIAAKLSDIRNGNWRSYITWKVHKYLNKKAESSSDGRNMWTKTRRTVGGKEWELYKSIWWRTP